MYLFMSPSWLEVLNFLEGCQLLVFIGGADDKYDVIEEMVSLVPLKGTTKSRDVNEAVKEMLKRFCLLSTYLI